MNQWLTPDKVKLLLNAGFSRLQVEFLGWLNGYAKAINNSQNPIKAAHTLLAKKTEYQDDGKVKSRGAKEMFEVFSRKKLEAVVPGLHSEHEELDEEFSKLERKIKKLGGSDSYDDPDEYRLPEDKD